MSEVSKPIVSVRLMTYNHADFIDEAMKGILMQETNFPVEIVVGDDFSTDGTLEKISKFKPTGNITIKVLQRSRADSYDIKRKERGRLYNFQNILENCTGKYIALLDGDDYWTDPLKLQKQVTFLDENPDYVITHHPWRNMIENTEPPVFKPVAISPRTCTLLFRNIVNDLPDEFCEGKNGDTFLRFYLKKYGKRHLIKEIEPAIRRIHAEGIMSNLSAYDKMPRRIDTHAALLKAYKGKPEEKEIASKLARYKIEYAVRGLFIPDKKPIMQKLKNILTLLRNHGQLKFTIKTLFQVTKKQLVS